MTNLYETLSNADRTILETKNSNTTVLLKRNVTDLELQIVFIDSAVPCHLIVCMYFIYRNTWLIFFILSSVWAVELYTCAVKSKHCWPTTPDEELFILLFVSVKSVYNSFSLS